MAKPMLVEAAPQSSERRRYPGVRSFEEIDRAQFHGRVAATEALLLRVLSVRLLLQFAPSGVGKTSLLNAGLFPELRPHNYFPFIIRLNRADESLVQAVRRSLSDAADEFGLLDPIIPECTESLWALLAGTQLWSRDLLLLTPVLVFDQFEEIFTQRDDVFRRAFASEVGELSSGVARMESSGGAATTSSSESSVPAVKIIISLREEYLGKLEEFSASIPDLFRERLRLPPLTASEAKEAIVEPAKLPSDAWISPAFEFEANCLDALIDFIDGVSDSVKIIEPLTLQLVCQQAETISMQHKTAGDGRLQLGLGDFGGLAGLERLVRDHYQKELAKIQNAATRKHAQKMFEDGLLDPAGKRLMLEQGEIERDYGLDKPTLDALVASSLLRREPRNESVFYEISHDRLTETIAKHRRPRMPRWVWPTIAVGGLLMALVVGGAIAMKSARDEAEYALQSLLSEDLVSRLRDAGLADALKQVLQKSEGNSFSAEYVTGLAEALKLRHQGDIERDRGTVHEARKKILEAQRVLDGLAQGEAGSTQPLLLAERARTRERLGSLLSDAGEVTEAEKAYRESVSLWDSLLKGAARSQDLLEAAETRIAFGALRQRLGDLDGADSEIVEANRLTMKVWGPAYDGVQSGHVDTNFELGRVLQIFTGAAFSRANIWGDEATAKAALALARESVRLRPLSFQARKQLSTTIANFGRVANDKSSAWALFDELRKQYDELGRVDPSNRLVQRESAAISLLISEVVGTCAEDPACKGKLPKSALDEAKSSTIESIGNFRWLAGLDVENRSLTNDIAWGLQIQARLLGASGSPALALSSLDDAIAATRKARVDVRDVESGLFVADLLQDKALQLEKIGKAREAIASLDVALAEIEGMPGSLGAVRTRWVNILDTKIKLLKKNSQTGEAERLQVIQSAENERLLKTWDARRGRATQLNDEGVQLTTSLNPQVGTTAAMEQYRQIVEKHEQAIKEYPFHSVLWGNLGRAQQEIATLAKKMGDVAVAPAPAPALQGSGVGPDVAMRDAALRAAFAAKWMAAVLSPTEKATESSMESVNARTNLAQFLRDQGRHQEALALMSQGALDAKEIAHRQPKSPEALYALAEANLGLAFLRKESGNAGWEETFRVAIFHGDQLAKLEPTNPERHNWLGRVHSYFATLLERENPEEAAEERKFALKACREGLHLAKKLPEQRSEDETCLKELAAQGGYQ